MEIKQIRLTKMAVFCYMVGDESSGVCALIDPAFHIKKILGEVTNRGYRVKYIINTHCHPDHTAGNWSVKERTGAKILIHEFDSGALEKISNKVFSLFLGGRGSPKPDILLSEGDIVRIGRASLKVIHTPGHTRGGVCLYAEGNIFTGDTLFVGAVGRTDLPGGSAQTLLRSIREKIYTLPGNTIVWPGHDYGMEPSTTVAREREKNPFTR